MAAEPEVFVLASAAAELSPGVVVLVVELSPGVVVLVVELSPEVVVLVAELSPEVVVLAVELSPGVVVLVSEPEVVSVAVVSVAHVAEPQASVDTAVAFHVSVPVFVAVVEVYSSGRPKFLSFPNVDPFANCPSSVEVVGEESAHSSSGAHTNYGLGNNLSNQGLRQNRNLEYRDNKPNPGHNNPSGTNDLPTDATTNHSRKTSLPLYWEQRKHYWYQAILPQPEALRIR